MHLHLHVSGTDLHAWLVGMDTNTPYSSSTLSNTLEVAARTALLARFQQRSWERLEKHHSPNTHRFKLLLFKGYFPGALLFHFCLHLTYQGFHSGGRGATMPSLASHRSSGSLSGSIPISRAYSWISDERWDKPNYCNSNIFYRI